MPNDEEHLLTSDPSMTELHPIQKAKSQARTGIGKDCTGVARSDCDGQVSTGGTDVDYKVYKRRWFGLVQLILLNIVESWGWLTYSALANTTATFFSTSSTTINWLSTAFLFAFVIAAPATLYAIRLGGPRLAFISASTLMLIGNWLRYAGTRRVSFPLVMIGQILIGLAQPFVLAAPTHYSNLWFSPRGRCSATAVASLANPLGGALVQLVNPLIATSPSDIPKITLYAAIIATGVVIPSFSIPIRPPSPSSPASNSNQAFLTVRESLTRLFTNVNFYLLLAPFTVYVGLFNSATSILTKVFTPYGFTEDESGIAGALLIGVGLVAAAILSPVIDRTKAYLLYIKILVPLIAACYLAFVWAPATRSLIAPYVILSILGASSFSLLPMTLELLVEVTYPVGPEVGSIIFWTGGQLFGGIFIIASDALQTGADSNPPYNMHDALIFQAVMAWIVVPAAMALGLTERGIKLGRKEIDGGVPSEPVPSLEPSRQSQNDAHQIPNDHEHARRQPS